MSEQLQVIYISEYAPNFTHHTYTSGGFDWAYSREDAFKCFERNISIVGDGHDCAFYRIFLPASWDKDKIQAWCEDHINCIPEVDVNYDPTNHRPSATSNA
jgi:hypothetical protein